MSVLRKATRGLATAALLLVMGGWANAAELKENTADIKQDIRIPGMAVTIKRPGNETGCNTANHEKWDTDKGRCSNTEYMKENAKVVSVQFDDPRLSIGVLESTTLKANVRTQDGQLVGAGVPVTWSTTKGYLSTYSNVTDSASQATVTLTTPKGTETGLVTVTASAKAGGANTLIAVGNSATVSSLTANPPVALADGVSYIKFEATLTYYENGKSVGPGESLIWGTMIGRFTYAENVTNQAGKAVAYLVSTEPGKAFVSATKDVAVLEYATFTSPQPDLPVINSFTQLGILGHINLPGTVLLDLSGQSQSYPYFSYRNIFSWSVEGADRYELIGPKGVVYYSGSGMGWEAKEYTEYDARGVPKGKLAWTLRAYKGQSYAERTIETDQRDTGCYSCGT